MNLFYSSHEVIKTRTSLVEGPTLYFGFMGGLLWGTPVHITHIQGYPKLSWAYNPSSITCVVVETVSDRTAFHANWLVTKVPLLLYFVRLRDQFFKHVLGEEEPIYDSFASFQEVNVHIYMTISCQFKCCKYCCQDKTRVKVA